MFEELLMPREEPQAMVSGPPDSSKERFKKNVKHVKQYSITCIKQSSLKEFSCTGMLLFLVFFTFQVRFDLNIGCDDQC